MMRRGFCALLFCMGLLLTGAVPAYAAEYILDEVYLEDGNSSGDLESSTQTTSLTVWDVYGNDYIPDEDEGLFLSSPSDATASVWALVDARGSYNGVYDGSMSSSYITYARDTVSKLPPGSRYVFFRPSQYEYRLVYGDDLEVSGSTFQGKELFYVSYNTRYNTMDSGSEGTFSLRAGDYLVYTNLEGMYPALESGVNHYEFTALLFIAVLYFLFSICRAFFSVGRFGV